MRDILRDGKNRIHLVGILGSGMMPLALLLHGLGYSISGSDTGGAESLLPRDVTVYSEHNATNIVGACLVVYSFAISGDCAELVEARRLGIPIATRAELLGAIMQDFACPIGVSGTHGKSTTTAMLGEIFSLAGLDPTVISGAKLATGSPLLRGDRGVLIYEACEYRDAFLAFSPKASVVLSIELDHVDYFKDLGQMLISYATAFGSCPLIALNTDDHGCHTLYSLLGDRAVSFGTTPSCDYRYELLPNSARGSRVRVYHSAGESEFTLSILGRGAVIDAVGAFAISHSLGIDDDIISSALSHFSGIERRIQPLCQVMGRPVYYDYAHHPTEIRETISALRAAEQKITVVFRPHTFSRTAGLFEGFVSSLSLADYAIILDVFAARESDIYGRGSRELADALGAPLLSQSEAKDYVLNCTEGAIVLMGAGDISPLRDALLVIADKQNIGGVLN